MPHVSVYVDESGDMGFTDNASEFFTIGYAFTVDRFPEKENKTIKRVLKNINTVQKKNIIEFKFSSNTDKVRKKFLKTIKKLDVELGVICISKDSVTSDLKKDPCRFYRYTVVDTIITHLVEDYFESYDHYNSIRFTIDRSLTKNAIDAFNQYCEDKIYYRTKEKSWKIDFTSNIHHEDSKNVPMLQVADYIASATQRYVVHGDPTFYEMYSNNLKYREKWDWNDKIDW